MKVTLLRYHQHYLRDNSLSPSENITGSISHCTLRLFAPSLTSLTVGKFFAVSYLKYSWMLMCAKPHTSWSFSRICGFTTKYRGKLSI